VSFRLSTGETILHAFSAKRYYVTMRIWEHNTVPLNKTRREKNGKVKQRYENCLYSYLEAYTI
jgi:hypothetical protein